MEFFPLCDVCSADCPLVCCESVINLVSEVSAIPGPDAMDPNFGFKLKRLILGRSQIL